MVYHFVIRSWYFLGFSKKWIWIRFVK